MTQSLILALRITSPTCLALALLLGLIYYKRLSTVYKYMMLYLLSALIMYFLSMILINTEIQYNLLLLPVFGLIEFIIFSLIYNRALTPEKKHSKFFLVFYILAGCLIIFDSIHAFTNRNPANFHCYSKIFVDLLIIVYCLLFFFRLTKITGPEQKHLVLFNSGVFVYFSFIFFINVSMNFLINERYDIIDYFWFSHALITILFHLYNAFLIWQNGKTRKPLQYG